MKYITEGGYKLLANGTNVAIDKVVFGNSGVETGGDIQGDTIYETVPHRIGTTATGFTVEAVIETGADIEDHEVIREVVLYSQGVPFVRAVIAQTEYISDQTALTFTITIELAQASDVILEVTNSSQYALQTHVEEAEKIVVDKINAFIASMEAKHTEVVNALNTKVAALENKVADNRRHTDNVNRKVDDNRRHTDNVNRKVDGNRRHHDGQHSNLNRKVDENRRRADSQHTGSINHTNSRYNSSINHTNHKYNQSITHANNLNNKHREVYHRVSWGRH